MTVLPSAILASLYDHSSLESDEAGVTFSLRNRLSPASIHRVCGIRLDGTEVALASATVRLPSGAVISLDQIAPESPLEFGLDEFWRFHLRVPRLEHGSHHIEISFDSSPFGDLTLKVRDELSSASAPDHIPRDHEDDYCPEIIRARQRFVREQCQAQIEHVTAYSFDPHLTKGNMEHFIGVAQVPLGLAGPLQVNGQHAQGKFFVPLATSEGTLVASYNRGMKLLNRCGGVKCAVVGDNMQRAPVFGFEDALCARRFADWVVESQDQIRTAAEATDPFVRLKYIDYYLAGKFAYLRFNYTTGDAGGQNMVGKATYAASAWILGHYRAGQIQTFYLESNLATDKKASMINTMRGRGKRVTAEALIKRDVLLELMGADTESLFRHSQIANVGCMIAGTNNNGLHSANAITAIFIATGQDVADVSESSAALVYTELNEDKDLYISITLPSLIVATCGGGTGLATQRECLEIMGCAGPGKVQKLAEIVAGTVLAGELSLACAISSDEWVSSHDLMGRNPVS